MRQIYARAAYAKNDKCSRTNVYIKYKNKVYDLIKPTSQSAKHFIIAPVRGHINLNILIQNWNGPNSIKNHATTHPPPINYNKLSILIALCHPRTYKTGTRTRPAMNKQINTHTYTQGTNHRSNRPFSYNMEREVYTTHIDHIKYKPNYVFIGIEINLAYMRLCELRTEIYQNTNMLHIWSYK